LSTAQFNQIISTAAADKKIAGIMKIGKGAPPFGKQQTTHKMKIQDGGIQ